MSTDANCRVCDANAKWKAILEQQAAEDAAAGYDADDDCDSVTSEENWSDNWWENEAPKVIDAVSRLLGPDDHRCFEAKYSSYLTAAYNQALQLYRASAAAAAAAAAPSGF
jgi:hypothetical protein